MGDRSTGSDGDDVPDPMVRIAGAADAERVGQLLHDFNTEFEEPTPTSELLAERVRQLLAGGDTTVLMVGTAPDGLAVLRFRAAIWTAGLEAYLAELYVRPQRRGRGFGRALLQAAIDLSRAKEADRMDLGTSESDIAARSLYESFGFINREGGPNGPLTYFYERDL